MKLHFRKIKLLMIGIALFVNYRITAMDKPGVNPLIKLSEFLNDKKANQTSDYSQLSVFDIEKIIKEINILLTPQQEVILLRTSQALQINPHYTWEYLQAIKRDLTEVGRVRNMLYDLLSKKNNGVVIAYEKIPMNDLLKLQAEVHLLLKPNQEVLIVAAGRRALVEPARVWDYLNAIKKDLSIAIEEKIEVEHKNVQKLIVPISL